MVKRIIATMAPLEVPRERKSRKGGFTLVELLTVLAIAAILAVLSIPAIQGLQKAGGFDKSLYAMADSLNLARSYAMANNTYVYVGLTEVNRAQSTLASPQAPGVGRVVMSIVATTDGTSDASSWNNSAPSEAASGAGLVQVRQPQLFDFFHIASSLSTSTHFLVANTGTTTMALPTNVTSTSSVSLVPINAATTLTTPFSLPLGSNTSGNSGKYNFTSNNDSNIICFNPQGEVLLNGTAVQWLEIDVQPMVGTVTPAAPTISATTGANQGNQAALLIDGVTGSITTHRP